MSDQCARQARIFPNGTSAFISLIIGITGADLEAVPSDPDVTVQPSRSELTQIPEPSVTSRFAWLVTRGSDEENAKCLRALEAVEAPVAPVRSGPGAAISLAAAVQTGAAFLLSEEKQGNGS